MRLLHALLFAVAIAMTSPARAQDPGEIAFWESVKDSKNSSELQAYLDAYPQGKFAALARIRLKAFGSEPKAAVPAGSGAAQPSAPAPAVSGPAARPAPAQPAAAGPRIAPEAPAYGPFEPIKIVWSNLPTSLTSGYLHLHKQGEEKGFVYKTIDLSRPEARRAGSQVFDGLLPGTYEARLLPAYSSQFVVARTRFTVQEASTASRGNEPKVVTDSTSYPPFEPIRITWSNLPPSLGNIYVRIYKDGQEQPTTQKSEGLTAQTIRTGGMTFDGMLPGTYEVRITGPNYDSTFMVARTQFTIADPNADEPTAAPEPQRSQQGAAPGAAAGTAEPNRQAPPAAHVASQATVPLATSRIRFRGEQPAAVAQPLELKSLIDAVQKENRLPCGNVEVFQWNAKGWDRTRLNRTMQGVIDGFKEQGYALQRLKGPADNTFVVRVDNPQPAPEDTPLLVTFYLEDERELFLVACTTSK